MLLALFVAIIATLSLCWLAFTLASLALPLFIGVLAADIVWRGGAGPLGALFVGLLAGAGALFAGHILLATLRGATPRALVLLAFAAPAAVAGYSMAHGLAAIGLASPLWRVLIGLMGGGFVALAAIARLDPDRPAPNRIVSTFRLGRS